MNFKLGNFLSLSCFRGLSGQMFWVLCTMCAGWIFSFLLIIPHALAVNGYSSITCGVVHLIWNVMAFTVLYLTSFLFILSVRCVAVKYLQR